MPAQQHKKQPADPKKNPNREQLYAVVGKRVLDALGQPGNFQRVQVRHLWEDHFRVNIFVGDADGCIRVAHSFFLVADAAGNIVTSTPDLKRAYGEAAAVHHLA